MTAKQRAKFGIAHRKTTKIKAPAPAKPVYRMIQMRDYAKAYRRRYGAGGDFYRMTMDQLKDCLRVAKIPIPKDKDDMVNRLEEHYRYGNIVITASLVLTIKPRQPRKL